MEVNTDEEPMVFKAQLFALTGVQPERQKVMLKGAILDQSWDKVKIKDGIMMLMMGTKDEDMPAQPVEKTKFLEDMDERELSRAMDMPAGLQVGFNFCASASYKLNHIFSPQNLGNTCYLNATVQCLKTVPELRKQLTRWALNYRSKLISHLNFRDSYSGSVSLGGGEDAVNMTAALRDLYSTMDRGSTVPPIILLQV